MSTFFNSKGYLLAELLIAMIITGILAMAGFRFYVRMQNEALAQEEVSEMQNNSRVSLEELTKALRMAGYKIDLHLPYLINGDSLYIFYNDTQPVDTLLYYLGEYQSEEESSSPVGQRYQLMRKVNSADAEAFADNIHFIAYTVISPSMIQIDLEVQAVKADEAFADNNGLRIYSTSDQVVLRNLKH